MSQQVPPTRMNLTLYKGKYVAAKKGYDLLKNKADALKVRFREICKVIYSTKIGMTDGSSSAFFSLTQAEYAAGNFRNKLLESTTKAQVRVRSRTDNVAGVKLPVFSQYETGVDAPENIGLSAGGRKIGVCREKFTDYLHALIKLASLQTSFIAMDEALKVTNRRVNALENVTIPQILKIIDDINRELDELEREDFTRLKVVKRKKDEAIKAEEKLRALKLKENAEQENTSISNNKPQNMPAPPPSVEKSNGSSFSSAEPPAAANSGAKASKKKGKKGNNGNNNNATISSMQEDEDVLFN